jgi:hypothetical protein
MLHPAVWMPFLLVGVILGALWFTGVITTGGCLSNEALWAGIILFFLGLGIGFATTPSVAVLIGGFGGMIAVAGYFLSVTGHC